jgi:hypothetical protein
MNPIRNRTPDEKKEKDLPEIQGGNHDARGGKERTREGNATGENVKEEMDIGLMLNSGEDFLSVYKTSITSGLHCLRLRTPLVSVTSS